MHPSLFWLPKGCGALLPRSSTCEHPVCCICCQVVKGCTRRTKAAAPGVAPLPVEMMVPKTQHLIMEVTMSQAEMARMAESRMMLHDTLYTLSASSTLAAMPASWVVGRRCQLGRMNSLEQGRSRLAEPPAQSTGRADVSRWRCESHPCRSRGG